jgi:NAD(P)-dependent dehydrogenase (short-subunit alcohol dehydrogenase family)
LSRRRRECSVTHGAQPRATAGRHASVDDIVPVISLLGSPPARWITGQDIQVDGGFISAMTAGAPIQL